MAPIALINAGIYVAGHDMTGETNKIMLSGEGDELDSTTFGSAGWRERVIGLRDVKASAEGFWASAASDAVDPESFTNLGAADRVMTITPRRLEAETCYISQFVESAYSVFDEIGTLAPFTLGLSGSNKQGLVRGQLGKAKGTVSATGVLGSACQLGAVGATQYLYGAFHVFPTAGTTISAKIESDNASNFPSAADVAGATVGPITATGATWMTRKAGPITDDWFRWNVTAVTGTFTVLAAFGVGS